MIENVVPILNVKDLSVSLSYYEQALGFTEDWTTGDFACVSRDRHCLYICEGNQGNPGTWIWIGVEDVDKLYQECLANGAEIDGEMVNNPWAREFRVADPDGHMIRFGGEPQTDPDHTT